MDDQGPPADSPAIYSVSRLAEEAKQLLDHGFPMLWVEGECSNVTRPRSGHLYLTLKDGSAQVRAAMFRSRNRLLRFEPQEGTQVLARVRVSLYVPRGDFQLIVEHMEAAGDGALRRAFEALKARLEGEGLFRDEHKQALPSMPQRIGVITSATGAAVRDVCQVLRRRFPALAVLVYSVRVQGDGAGDEIAAAIRRASQRAEVDALLVTRGGGSLEDLWAFNEEVVARAIHDCALPVVSAVGHETDVTIADLVADVRAPTPSAGAECLSPDGTALRRELGQRERQLRELVARRLNRYQERRRELEARLHTQHPGRRLQERSQRLDEIEARLTQAQRGRLTNVRTRFGHAHQRLHQCDPRVFVGQRRERVHALYARLAQAGRHAVGHERDRLATLVRTLESVSPLATVQRGYAILRTQTSGQILRSIEGIDDGELLRARVSDGELICRVEGREALTNPLSPSASDNDNGTLTDEAGSKEL
jgi:exodeoxyribonuclease VII large subunit